jgi:putative ABC transport system permease protein
MKTFSLALRNLLRNRRRSLTTLLAMIIGAVCILLFGGYSHYINLGLETGYVRSGGHLQVQHRDYFLYGDGDPLDYGVAGYPHVMAVLKSDPVLAPMLTVVTPTLQIGGIAGNYAAGVSRTVMARGDVVEEQQRMRQWDDYDFTSRHVATLPLFGTAPDAAVIGRGLARVLQLCGPLHVAGCRDAAPAAGAGAADMPEDIAALQKAGAVGGDPGPAGVPRIELLAATSHGAPNVAELSVVQAQEQGIKQLDDMFVGMHLAAAQHLVYGSGPPAVTAIELQLQHTGQIPAARARLQQLMAGPLRDEPLEIQDFQTLNPFYGQTLGLFAAIFGFIAILIGAIVLFTVSNTMGMAVVERTVEIGTLRALGLRRSGIRRLFLCEGLLLGVAGAVLGVLTAMALATFINQAGLTWLPPGNVDPVPLRVRVSGAPLIGGTAMGLLCVAMLSAWWPARRAARLNVVEALRHV